MILVSVIIPTYSRPERLKRAIQSVLAQEIDELEIIIVDDCSDNSQEKPIDEIASKSGRIRFFRNERNLGAAESRNIGIEKAKGRYLLFLDDDDCLKSNMIVKSLEVFSSNDIDAVSCRSYVLGENLSRKKLVRYNRQQKEDFRTYSLTHHPREHIFLYVPQIHTFLVKREIIGDLKFQKEMEYGEDLQFWLSLAAKGCRFRKLDFVGCEYHVYDQSTTGKIKLSQKLTFYNKLYTENKDNQVIKNLIYIKKAFLYLKNGKAAFLSCFIKALSQPVLFFRHFWYYTKTL